MRSASAGLPTDARIAGGLPSQSDHAATRRSGARRPILSGNTRRSAIRRSTTPGSWAGSRSRPGYEFQQINVEVQDVNPLYGLDTYTGQFSRPAGVAANNLYNLADFMLGLRSQYALTRSSSPR